MFFSTYYANTVQDGKEAAYETQPKMYTEQVSASPKQHSNSYFTKKADLKLSSHLYLLAHM